MNIILIKLKFIICDVSVFSVPLVSCKTNVYGSYGKSTTLECSLTPVSAIEWYDWVFSLEADVPATIYKDGEVNDDEYHGGRFSVDSDTGALTISDLNIDDAGTYFCMTGEDQKEEFNLILAGSNPLFILCIIFDKLYGTVLKRLKSYYYYIMLLKLLKLFLLPLENLKKLCCLVLTRVGVFV